MSLEYDPLSDLIFARDQFNHIRLKRDGEVVRMEEVQPQMSACAMGEATFGNPGEVLQRFTPGEILSFHGKGKSSFQVACLDGTVVAIARTLLNNARLDFYSVDGVLRKSLKLPEGKYWGVSRHGSYALVESADTAFVYLIKGDESVIGCRLPESFMVSRGMPGANKQEIYLTRPDDSILSILVEDTFALAPNDAP